MKKKVVKAPVVREISEKRREINEKGNKEKIKKHT